MKKVLVIALSYSSNSGAGRYTSSSVRHFKELGVEPVILTRSDFGEHPGVHNVLLPPTSLKALFKNILICRKYAKGITNIHAFDGWPLSVYGLFTVLGTSKKFFINGVGTYGIVPKKKGLKRFLMRWAYRRAHSVYSISQYTQDRIEKEVQLKNAKVVLLGSTKLPETSSDYLESVRKKYNITDNHPICLTVGEIKHRKGQLDTFKAIHSLKKQYPNILYIIIGSGGHDDYVERIRDYAKEHNLEKNVLIIRDIPKGDEGDRQLSALYQIADVFCLNSNNEGHHFEGFGLVFLEAGQFGKPGVGSKGCGIESAVINGYNGRTAEQGNEQDIAQAITDVLDDYDTYSKNSIKHFDSFDWLQTAKHYIQHYE